MKLAVSLVIAVVAMVVGAQAQAQERAGVVTTLEGNVTVARASLPQPAPLRFKDDIFVLDRVTTSKDSVARLLLGGRAVVTVREHSTVTITETPGVAIVDVATGRVAVAVAREKMQQGDVVQVKTPNAVAGIRGTVIVAEVLDADHSVITVLKGTIDVTRQEAGHLVGPATIVTALQRVTITGGAPVSAPQLVAPAAARQLGQEFRLAPPRATPPATSAAVNAVAIERASKDLAKLGPRVAAERRLRADAPDDDQDDGTPDARSASSRDKWDKAAKPETAKARTEGMTTEVPPAVKNFSRTTDAVYPVPDATKYTDKNGRGKGGRDR
jgi:hypothetical protein